ncbi:FACT complex subunit ssrp1 [Coemansia sp. RSA 2399]|nr:FACT complex subunit ssrp1 [Coemansia sp. RSA 2399]KAJ1907772.1 FACT complex subunit ssrp1 [Coemansia sp. IMI 209127]
MVAEPHKRVADAYSTLAKVYNRIANTSDEVKPVKSRLRDPNHPKRPLSSYLMFANENRDAILRRFPGILPKDVPIKSGQIWKALPEEERKKYQDRATILRAQYDVDVKKYKTAAVPSDEENERPRTNGTTAAATLNEPGDYSTNDVSDLVPASIQHPKKSRKKHHTEEGVEKRKKKKSSKSSGAADEAPKKKKRAK